MIVFPNAKINIGLQIVEKRSDGFHNIESVFYPIGWKDALEALPAKQLSFSTSGLIIPGNTDDNLIIKAFELIKPFLKTEISTQIHLHKAIPMGAGLGGGSADGAYALKLFNAIFELKLSTKKLETLAEKLGSDCPFFIQNKPIFCYDRGIRFKPVTLDISAYFIGLVNPEIHISTGEAYAAVKPKPAENSLLDSIQKPLETWKDLISNDFEQPMKKKYPVIADIIQTLYANGAKYAAMTGSGSTVYGIFETEINLKNLFPDFVVWNGKLP